MPALAAVFWTDMILQQCTNMTAIQPDSCVMYVFSQAAHSSQLWHLPLAVEAYLRRAAAWKPVTGH